MKNEAGVYPVEYKVLVLLEKVEETTEGGLYLPETTREKEEWAAQRGTLMAVGGNAFEDVKEPIPKVGNKVYFARYAGNAVDGKDGERYSLMSDKEIIGIIEE